ncbi:MAG: hypothetical protein QG671_1778 [Actinomycetota bacterium]|nr:hypothetical protein [Actinomycetota bacterium]
MAIGSGLGSQVGYSLESGSYGTYTAPTKFLRAKSYSVTPKHTRVQGEGIQPGILGPYGAHYVETAQAAEASLAFDVQTTVMGLLLQATTGGTSTAVAVTGSTGAYLHTHTLGDNVGKSYTIQSGRPTRAGTLVPATLSGGKVTSAEFTCEANGILGATLSIDGQKWDNTTALATASYTASSVFTGKEMCLKGGTVGAETSIAGVRSVAMTFNRPMDVEDYTACAGGLKAEPVQNEVVDITGTLKADWLAKATFEDLANANTSTSLVWEFVKATAITGSTYPTFRITLPGVYFESKGQDVPGRDVLTTDWAFTWRYDGTNLPSVVQITTDSAL